MTTIAHQPDVRPLLEKAGAFLPPEKLRLIEEAYDFARDAHSGQTRLTGDPYIVHPLDAAMTVASLELDAATIAAALLHDVQEDCGVPNEEIRRRFGVEVARLVDGATKLEKIPWRAPSERPGDQTIQAESLRKMFLAMADDWRVVLIKLADRLHNMRTLDAKPPEKRLRTAAETMEIYAPLANRLGIWQLKWELEDLAFRHLEPERYKEIARLVQAKRTVRERYIAQVEKMLNDELKARGIEAEIKGRAKHIYSIAQKVDKYAVEHKSFDQIYDLLALRVLVDTVGDCYNALGVVHGLWHPMPGQFDDYIASPKESLYQSLHTTVMAVGGRPLEVQIRTHEMHQLAEYGVAAHWRYKEGGKRNARDEARLAWMRQVLEWQRDMSHAEEFVESVKTDIFQDQVFVYTPKGEIKEMPTGATPIDFAYRVHTELGHKCIGGKVNGRLVPLNYQLKNGDIVEILVGKNSRGPSRDWLNPNLGYIKTGHTREKIRQWFKKQERAENIERGREIIEKELRRLNLSLSECRDDVLKIFKYDALDDFLAALGYGGISSAHIAVRLAPLVHRDDEPQLREAADGVRAPVYGSSSIQVLGTGDLLTQIARCCNPVPGDEIMGYVTRSRGVTIHRNDCYNVLHEDEKERLVDVEWGQTGALYPAALTIEAWDRVGLLRDVSTLISEEKVNMGGVRTQEHGDRTTTVYLTLETSGVAQLSRVMAKLESVRGVISVNRQVDGTRRSALGSL